MKIELTEIERAVIVIAATNRAQHYAHYSALSILTQRVLELATSIVKGENLYPVNTWRCITNWLFYLLDEKRFSHFNETIENLIVKIQGELGE